MAEPPNDSCAACSLASPKDVKRWPTAARGLAKRCRNGGARRAARRGVDDAQGTCATRAAARARWHGSRARAARAPSKAWWRAHQQGHRARRRSTSGCAGPGGEIDEQDGVGRRARPSCRAAGFDEKAFDLDTTCTTTSPPRPTTWKRRAAVPRAQRALRGPAERLDREARRARREGMECRQCNRCTPKRRSATRATARPRAEAASHLRHLTSTASPVAPKPAKKDE